MNHKYLNGLFLPAVAGLFLFNKWYDDEEIEDVYPVYTSDSSGLTGVAKYLKSKEDLLKANSIHGQMGENEECSNNLPKLSGVSRYLQEKDKIIVSGVTKYLLKKALVDKQTGQAYEQAELTGVAKYLKSQKVAPVLSGVAKYLKHQESLPQPSKVARYVARQNMFAKQIKQSIPLIEVTGVARYLKQLDNLPQPSKVARYMAKQALEAKQHKQIVVHVEATGVAKYLKLQESLPKTSRVAKYLTRQSLTSKQKLAKCETSVEKYMRNKD